MTVLEKRDGLGGRAYTYKRNGFTFDGGPTIITAPWLFDEIWAKAGRRREDYVTFVKCDPFYRIFDHHGVPFDYNDDERFIVSEIEKRNPADVAGYRAFVARTKEIFDKGFVELADKHLPDGVGHAQGGARSDPPAVLQVGVPLRVGPHPGRLPAPGFFVPPAVGGGNPFDTTSIYAMIHYLERRWGVWYALGGTGALVEAFGRLIGELGGRIELNAEVAEILVDPGARRVRGVRLVDGRVIEADVVVSNADVAFTYRNLIAPEHRRKYSDRRLERMRYAMSLFVIYFGTQAALPRHRTQAPQHHSGPALPGAAARHLPQRWGARRGLQPVSAHAHLHRSQPGARGRRGVLCAVARAEPQVGHRLAPAGQAVPRRHHALPRGALPPGSGGEPGGGAHHRPPPLPGHPSTPSRARPSASNRSSPSRPGSGPTTAARSSPTSTSWARAPIRARVCRGCSRPRRSPRT